MSTAVKAVPSVGETLVPPAPVTVKDTGLTPESISDLVLKTLYVQGSRTGQQLTDTLCLPFDVVDEQLVRLQERRFIEVLRTMGPSRGGYVFEVAGAGRDRAMAALEASQYVGAAPVTLNNYRAWIEAQSVRNLHIGRVRIREGFKHLVINEHMLEQLGPAVNSASSLFLHGDPGNGKTVIAEAIAAMLGGDIYIPYAVDVEGQIMSLFDPVHHEPVEQPLEVAGGVGGPQWLRQTHDHDRRYVRIKRPVVFVGGELALEQLDLQYDTYTKMYQAPFQLKAAGGVLIIDDFGRQLVAPRDLLNRWIVPLEKRVDFLTLHTGIKFPVPFDCLLIFATNLNPEQLVDEAFLRRIQYKLNVVNPDRSQYDEIFRRECTRRGVAFDGRAIEHIYTKYYRGRGILPRCCHPRDILDHLEHAARYEEREMVLTPALLDQACESYFLVMAHQDVSRSSLEA
ncbi:MAG: ATP-binding protein [Longimicrobiales bacterium]